MILARRSDTTTLESRRHEVTDLRLLLGALPISAAGFPLTETCRTEKTLPLECAAGVATRDPLAVDTEVGPAGTVDLYNDCRRR